LGLRYWVVLRRLRFLLRLPPPIRLTLTSRTLRKATARAAAGAGQLAVCDGEKYPDGSFWHQWMKTWMTGPQFYYDCVGGDEPVPGPPPPGGCDGEIPPEQPAPPAT